MHIDLDQTPAGQTFQSTVCVIGGGIAGLLLATRLANRGIDVHLLEGGGLQFEERSQALYRAEMSAENHRGTNDGRFRTFGGSSTRWGGQVLPFTPDIFSPPSGVPSLPWPVKDPELAPYYQEIEDILGVDHLPFTADLLPALGQRKPPSTPDIVVRFAKWAPFQKRNLAQTVGAEALAQPKITVFTHANALSLSASPSDSQRIESVRVRNYSQAEFTFRASHFVLCAGTVESARLLLCSPDIPNPHDQIGRYLHDHVAYHAAQFVPPGREQAVDLLGPFYANGTIHSAKLEASPELRARARLLAVMAHIVILEPEDSGTAAIRNLLRSLQSGQIKQAVGTNLLPLLRGLGDVTRLLLYSRFKKRRAVSKRAELRLNIDVEQAPDPNNRIRLSDSATDAFGLPVTVIDWQLGEAEKDTAARFAYLIQNYLEAAHIDPQHWSESVLNHTEPPLLDTNHAMGGLRMGEDPAHSVVDRNLAVHGLRNLHVASCAVFPSGSSSNPTFTMMALSQRLADHLAHLLPTRTQSAEPSHILASQS